MSERIEIKGGRFQPAPAIFANILDATPRLAAEALSDGTYLTAPWWHGPVDAQLPSMHGHLLATHHSPGPGVQIAAQDGTSEGLMAGDAICLIPQGSPCSLQIDGAIHISHVYLSQKRLRRCARTHFGTAKTQLLLRAGYKDPVAASLLRVLSLYAPSLATPSTRRLAEHTVDLLCLHLLGSHAAEGSASLRQHRGLADWQVRKVTDFIAAHLDRPLSLDDLAAQVRLSRCHFATAFRKATGHTPHEWLVLQRITRACDLLTNARQAVTDVALSVGFETPSAFSAAFRRLKGVTPTVYRRSVLDAVNDKEVADGLDYELSRSAPQANAYC